MKQEAISSWDQIAEGYHQYVNDTENWLANEALDRVELQPGQSFLDVAAGCGGLSLPAARRGAMVLATDWSPQMVSIFNRTVKEESLPNARGEVMDGHNLEFEDHSFDLVGSQFGVMLFSDQPKALKEMVRVTRPGGKVLMITYGTPDKVEFLGFFIRALQTVREQFEGLPADPLPLEFQAADPKVLGRRLTETGLNNVQVDSVQEKLQFRSGQQFWNWVLHGNPIVGQILSMLELSEKETGEVKQQLEEMIKEKGGRDQQAVLANMINIGFGVV